MKNTTLFFKALVYGRPVFYRRGRGATKALQLQGWIDAIPNATLAEIVTCGELLKMRGCKPLSFKDVNPKNFTEDLLERRSGLSKLPNLDMGDDVTFETIGLTAFEFKFVVSYLIVTRDPTVQGCIRVFRKRGYMVRPSLERTLEQWRDNGFPAPTEDHENLCECVRISVGGLRRLRKRSRRADETIVAAFKRQRGLDTTPDEIEEEIDTRFNNNED